MYKLATECVKNFVMDLKLFGLTLLFCAQLEVDIVR